MTADHMDVIGIGAINVDYIAPGSTLKSLSGEFKQELLESFEHGTEKAVEVEDAKQAIEDFGRNNLKTFLGGSALLTIQALAALHAGLSLGYVGVCGNLSSHLNLGGNWWHRWRIDDRWVRLEPSDDPGLCVSYVLDGERTLCTTPCANRKMAKHLTENFDAIAEYVAQAKIVHVSSFLDNETPEVLGHLLLAAKRRNPGLRISFDPGHCWVPPQPAVKRILEITDYLFLNDREFHVLAQPRMRMPRPSIECAERIISQCNRGTAVLRLRAYDAVSMYYYFGEALRERRFGEPLKPDAIEDATGAGDAFSAGFLSALCAPGFSPSNGVDLGLRLARRKLSLPGTTPFADFASILQTFVAETLDRDTATEKRPVIFVGHGRETVWKSLMDHLRNKVGNLADVVAFEADELPGRNVGRILEGMVGRATFAVIIMTPEDQMPDGSWRARQNVIHEAGLFQGRLGNEKVALLVDQSIQPPTNLSGLLHVPFSNRRIEDTYERLDRALVAAGLTA